MKKFETEKLSSINMIYCFKYSVGPEVESFNTND